jgi:hypothetical protein
MTAMHLWEAKHAYYCADGNWYNNECTTRHHSWGDFILDMGEADEDYNLVFRWDWKPETDDEGNLTERGKAGHGTLQICYMQQRKGKYVTHFVEVDGSDEDAVRAFLEPKMRHLMSLWAPLSATLTAVP